MYLLDFNYAREPNVDERNKFSRDIYRVEDSQLAEAVGLLEQRCPGAVVRVSKNQGRRLHVLLPLVDVVSVGTSPPGQRARRLADRPPTDFCRLLYRTNADVFRLPLASCSSLRKRRGPSELAPNVSGSPLMS